VSDYQAMRRDQARVLIDALPAAGRRVFKSEAGDLRGIPVIGFGVGGVSPGSAPGSPASLRRIDRELESRVPMVGFA
jgi:hypothetical protein